MATTTLSNTAANPAAKAAAPAIVKVSAPGGVLKAPDLPSASGPGEIVALQLQNNTGSAQKPGEVTFGHVFRQARPIRAVHDRRSRGAAPALARMARRTARPPRAAASSSTARVSGDPMRRSAAAAAPRSAAVRRGAHQSPR